MKIVDIAQNYKLLNKLASKVPVACEPRVRGPPLPVLLPPLIMALVYGWYKSWVRTVSKQTDPSATASFSSSFSSSLPCYFLFTL